MSILDPEAKFKMSKGRKIAYGRHTFNMHRDGGSLYSSKLKKKKADNTKPNGNYSNEHMLSTHR